MRDLVQLGLESEVNVADPRELRGEIVEGALFREVCLTLLEPVDSGIDALKIQKSLQRIARRTSPS